MEIILLQRSKKLGQIGDIVKVKDGYARNFLLPNNLALKATLANKKYFETQKHEIEAKNLELKKEAESIAPKITNTEVVAVRTAGEGGHLYGSVTAKDIVALLHEQHKITLDKTQVELPHAIKNLGVYVVTLLLHADVSVTIYVNVARGVEDAKVQMVNFLKPTAQQKKAQAEAQAQATAEAVEVAENVTTEEVAS